MADGLEKSNLVESAYATYKNFVLSPLLSRYSVSTRASILFLIVSTWGTKWFLTASIVAAFSCSYVISFLAFMMRTMAASNENFRSSSIDALVRLDSSGCWERSYQQENSPWKLLELTETFAWIELIWTFAWGSSKSALNLRISEPLMSLPGGTFFRTFFFPQAKLWSVRRSSSSSVHE